LFALRLFLFLLVSAIPLQGFSQPGVTYQEVFRQGNFSVSIGIKESKSSCTDTEPPCTYKYRIKGRYTGREEYFNWSLVIRDCNGDLKRKYFGDNTRNFREEGIYADPSEYKFTCREVLTGVEKDRAEFSNTPKRFLESAGSLNSTAPAGIDAPAFVFDDLPATLKVQGGELGLGARWAWYRNRTDTLPIYFGESIEIRAGEAGIWYVRAESPSGNPAPTDFASREVRYNPGMAAPVSLSGKNLTCPGSRLRLEVRGGARGTEGQWAWYAGSCGGRLLKKSRDPFLEWEFKESSEVFVRAEADNFPPTACASMAVQLAERNEDPSSLTGPQEICEGESISLTVNGKLVSGSKWEIIRGMCAEGTVIQSGTSPTFTLPRLPGGDYTFSVRATGECGSSRCVYLKTRIMSSTRRPMGINLPSTLIRGAAVTASPAGGQLGRPAEWVWYFGSSFSEKKIIGRGETLSFTPKRSGILYLGTENNRCDRSEPMVQATVNPGKARMAHRYFNTKENYRKVLHFGVNLGLEVGHYTDKAQAFDESGGLLGEAMAYNSALGWRIGAEFNPIYTRTMSLGLKTGFVTSSGSVNLATNSGKYRAILNDLTFTIGSPGLRLLTRIQNANEDVSMNTRVTVGGVGGFARTIGRKEYSLGYGIGMRIGGTTRRDKSARAGRALDLYYLNRNSTADPANLLSPEMGYRCGFGINYWVQNGYFTGLEILSSQRYSNFFPSGLPNLNNAHVRVVFCVQVDRFY
jgi:hypothetical protein